MNERTKMPAQKREAWFTPSLRRKGIIGHQLVKPEWKRFKPTKAVNRYP
jgi:hypothetical protein